MRGVLLLCVLLCVGSGCRALASRQGLTGAAREASDWAAALAAAPGAPATADATAMRPPAPPLATPEAGSGGMAAQPASVVRAPEAAEAADVQESPLEDSNPPPAAQETPSGPLAALQALLLQPPRVGSDPAPEPAPEPAGAHPTPARSTWRRIEEAGVRAPAEDDRGEGDGDDSAAHREVVAPVRARRLPQPPISWPDAPDDSAALRAAEGRAAASPLPWRKPRS